MNQDEQLKILRMVADGIVTAEEGENLLDVLENTAAADPKYFDKPEETTHEKGSWLRYMVIDEKSGVESVNLRVPSRFISGWFNRKGKLPGRSSENEIAGSGDEKRSEQKGLFLNILGENDGKRFKLYFE